MWINKEELSRHAYLHCLYVEDIKKWRKRITDDMWKLAYNHHVSANIKLSYSEEFSGENNNDNKLQE